MSVNIVSVDEMPSTLTAPADGEAVSQAIMVSVLQGYADAITFLKNRLYGPMEVPLTTDAKMTTPGYYEWSVAANVFAWTTAINTLSTIYFPIPIPVLLPDAAGHYPRITRFYVTTKGAGHGGAPAATPMVSNIVRRSGTPLTSVVATVTDTGGAGIDSKHDWTPASPNHELDPNSSYWLTVTNEDGANAQANSVIYRAVLEFSAPAS